MSIIEKYLPLLIQPGVYNNGTKYQAKGRWFSANGVRWYNGQMCPIGGWSPVTDFATDTAPVQIDVDSPPRMAHAWRDDDAISRLAIGTTDSLVIYTDGALNDVTPTDLATDRQDGGYVVGGYGTGLYGLVPYGEGGGATTLHAADTWQLDNFGSLLVACDTADGRILVADFSGSDAAPAGGGAPVDNTGLVVTPEGFLVALGAGGDPRLIQWADQYTTNVWNVSSTTSAGSIKITTRGRLVAGRRTRRQTLLWTDVDLYAMTFIGGIGVYGIEQLGENCGAVSPNSMVSLGDTTFWMSYNKFFMYDGAVKPLPCDVIDFLTHDLNYEQISKIVAVPNTLFDEIIWFYPSGGNNLENAKYVSYNFRENHWGLGTLARSAGVDRGVFTFPIWLDNDGKLWNHENGDSRLGLGTVFAESGPIENRDSGGYPLSFEVLRVQRYIPDQKTAVDVFAAPVSLENALPAVGVRFFSAFYPNETEKVYGPYAAGDPTSLRFTGRQFRMRIEENQPVSWRFGVPQLGILPAGRR